MQPIERNNHHNCGWTKVPIKSEPSMMVMTGMFTTSQPMIMALKTPGFDDEVEELPKAVSSFLILVIS